MPVLLAAAAVPLLGLRALLCLPADPLPKEGVLSPPPLGTLKARAGFPRGPVSWVAVCEHRALKRLLVS